MEKKIRNSNIELLRLCLMIAIFVWHIIMHGFMFTEIGLPNSNYIGSPYIDIPLLALLSPATYCFIFISGYFGMHYSNRKLGQLIFSALSVFAFMYIRNIIKYESIQEGGFLNLFPISTEVWWFLTCYVSVFVISPILNRGITHIERKTFKNLLVILLFFIILRFFKFTYSCGSTFTALLTIYLLGRYMSIYKIKISPQKASIAFVLSFIILCGGVLFFYINFHNSTNKILATFPFWFISSYNNPFTIIMAVALFYLINDISPKYYSMINMVASPSLFIYLITEGFYTVYGRIANILYDEPAKAISLSIILLASCLIYGFIVQKCYNMLFEKIKK